jgi:hypothetical protein
LFQRSLLPLFHVENIRSPKFLGEPSVNMPRSWTPALSDALGSSASHCCLPRRGTVSAYGQHPRFRGSITRPVHSLCTLHVTGHPAPRNTRFQPVTNLCWIGLSPIGSR